MARQFLGAPASSAGVERVFSVAGKMQVDEGPVPQAFALRLLQHQVGVSTREGWGGSSPELMAAGRRGATRHRETGCVRADA